MNSLPDFSSHFIETLSSEMSKEAFLGRMAWGGTKAVGRAVKFPFSGFKNSKLKHFDEEFAWLGRKANGDARMGLKGLGLKNVAGAGMFSAPFAAMGAHQYGSRAAKSTTKAYNPQRSNLMSPVTQKSPMGNIF